VVLAIQEAEVGGFEFEELAQEILSEKQNKKQKDWGTCLKW
jgi:hypothetical protein